MAARLHSSGQHGASLVEVTLMGLLLSALLVVITQSISSLSSTRSELRQQAGIGSLAARLCRVIEQEVTCAQRTFTSCADDLAWLQAMAIGGGLLQAGHQLPALTDRGLFERDPPATAETGDLLFLATRADRVSDLVIDAAGQALTPPVQTYRFVLYVPGETAHGTDLLRWVSDPLADYWDVESIADPGLRAEAWAALYQHGLRLAWDPQQPRAHGLFAILQGGGTALLGEGRTVAGAEDAALSRALGPRRMRIAGNHGLHGLAVPEFANARGVFPGGFEVKIDGGAAGKLVLFRLVIESTMPHRRQVCGELRRVVGTRS